MGVLRLLGVLFLSVTVAAPAFAGWLIVDKDGEQTFLSEGRMHTASDNGGMILNGPRKEAIFIDDQQRIYAQGTIQEFCSASAAMYKAMAESMPPEQRAMMEQMMGGGKKASQKVAVKHVGSGGVVAGYPTEKYEVRVDGKLYEEVWLATDADLLREMKELIPLAQEFSTCQSKMGVAMENSPENSPEYKKMMADGWEMKTIDRRDGYGESSLEVVRIEKKDIPAAEFAPPAGYRKVSFDELMGSQMNMQ